MCESHYLFNDPFRVFSGFLKFIQNSYCFRNSIYCFYFCYFIVIVNLDKYTKTFLDLGRWLHGGRDIARSIIIEDILLHCDSLHTTVF